MKWWNDLWLNEGFASFVEYIGSDHVDPTWKMMDQFITIALIPALQLDSLSNSHPVSVTVQDPGEIGELFDTISYNKGASIIRMLEGFIGRDNLQKGLRSYLDEYKYMNAQTDDLWKSLGDVSKIDVKKVMDTWTLQMGYPVVTLKRKNSQFTAEQSPFLLNPNSEHSKEYNSPFGYKWEVPLTYVTSENSRQMKPIVWMEKGSAVIDVSPETRWIKANVNMTGFYRVHYDENNWKALSEQLLLDHRMFTAADRAGLIDDAFSLAAAGHMKASQALDLIEYLKDETDFLPWKVALSQLQFVLVHIQDLPIYEDFKLYFTTLLESILTKLQDSAVSYLDRQLKVDVMTKAVIYNQPEAVKEAKKKFDAWMHNGTKVDPKIKQAIYRAGIQYGGQKEWDFCWEQYKKTNVPSEKHHLLYALAMTSDATQLNRYLYMSLEEDKIRSQDAISVIGAVSLSSSAGKTLAWSFVKRQWGTIMKRFSGSAFKIPNLINKVPAGLTTPYDYQEVKEFFDEHPVEGATRAVAQALEKIQMRIDWIARNEADITNWTKNWAEKHKKEISDKNAKKRR